MPTGTPDFGAQISGSVVSPTYDQGEASNHILMGGGSLSRSGRWVWATGFENGNNSDFLGSGIEILGPGFPDPAWQGDRFLRIRTTNTIDNSSSFYKYFVPSQALGKWGLECMLLTGSLNAEYTVMFFSIDNARTVQYMIRIVTGATLADTRIYYLDNVGLKLMDSPGASFAVDRTGLYHNIKIVVDFANAKYSRVLLDGTVYDLGGIDGWPGAGGTDRRGMMQITVKTKSASIAEAYVDNVILTADEP